MRTRRPAESRDRAQASPIRRDNKRLSLVGLIRLQMSLKAFTKQYFKGERDFNILIFLIELNKQPTAVEHPVASVTSLIGVSGYKRKTIFEALGRLIAEGYIIKEAGYGNHVKPNTYHLTRAGMDIVTTYYEQDFIVQISALLGLK